MGSLSQTAKFKQVFNFWDPFWDPVHLNIYFYTFNSENNTVTTLFFITDEDNAIRISNWDWVILNFLATVLLQYLLEILQTILR